MFKFMKRKRKEESPKADVVVAVMAEKVPTNPSRDGIELFNANLSSVAAATKDYGARKNTILVKERGTAWDSKAIQTATENEKKAANIIWKIREDERDNLFGNKASEALPGPETLDMGGQFLTNKHRMETRSQLFKIAHRVPKGCHLHLHFNAELAPGMLIRKANDMSTMFVRSTQPLLSPNDYDVTEVVFEVKPADTQTGNIFAADYRPEWKSKDAQPWMAWSKFKEQFAQHRREQKHEQIDAVEWVRKKMVLSEEEVYGLSQTTNGIWARFNQATRAFKGLMNYESLYRWYIGSAIDSMISDGVMYAELRPMLLDKSIPSDDGTRKLNHSDQMQLIIEEVQRKMRELEAAGTLDQFPFGLKIIYCAPRSIPKEMMRREITDCIKLKQEFPELICGFDLVGAEDRPHNIGYYNEELLAMQKTCAELNIEIPFMFHAGESLLDCAGSKDASNSNLYDAVLLKAKRIGHGFALLKHPVLVQAFKDNNICIELCPTSNELLHLCRNIKEHPFPQILAAGIECTVNSDNPSLFSNSVSHEFYQIMVGSPMMNLHGWRQLVEWSIKHSCLNEAQKKQAREILAREWEVFCVWVIDTYGESADKLDIQH